MLTLTHLKKSFGSLIAVDGISLSVNKGEIFGLLGPNGAGKSTTINMALGLLAPDSGSVDIAGLGSPVDPRIRARLGAAPQSLAIYEDLTGRENVEFFARLYDPRASAAKTDRVLEMVGLAERARDLAKTYSGGMKRRLNFACAIAHGPELLLLDEPTVGVDPQSRSAIFDLVLALKREGCTVVYTTHYMEEAQRLCDRVGIIDRGRLLEVDTVPALIARHGGRSSVRVERAGRSERFDTTDPIGTIAAQMSAGGIDHIQIDPPNLESVFLNLTGKSLRD